MVIPHHTGRGDCRSTDLIILATQSSLDRPVTLLYTGGMTTHPTEMRLLAVAPFENERCPEPVPYEWSTDVCHETGKILLVISYPWMTFALDLDMGTADEMTDEIRQAMTDLARGPNPAQPTLADWHPEEPF